VSELLAQEFLLVRCEINHQEPAARTQYARRFADCTGAVIKEVQNLMKDDDVEGIIRQRQIVNVALPYAAIPQARAFKPIARQQQHIKREVETEPALDVRSEHLEHASGAGAEIEQRAKRFVSERGADRTLHRFVGDV